MPSQSRRQLVLDLVSAGRARPAERAPEGLLQALADLLLEALVRDEQASVNGGRDESEDHR